MALVKEDHIRCGPFYASFYRGEAGDIFRVVAHSRVRKGHFAWRRVIVRGSIELISAPPGAPPRPKIEGRGGDSAALPDVVPGVYEYRCREPFLMVSACTANPPQPFHSEIVERNAGETLVVPKGGVLVFGEGVLRAGNRVVEAPRPIYAQSGDVTFTVVQPVLGVVAWR